MKPQFKILPLLIFLFLNSAATQSPERLSSQTEWRALLDLRSSLGIAARDWHRKANPCTNWTGIECAKGHVTRIELSGLRRTRAAKLTPGFAIDSLQELPLLSTFNSSGFSLKGSIPDWLGQNLSNLKVLDLRSCSIYGSIPSSLGSLNSLTSLYLSNNSITGSMPTTLGKMLSLSVLDFSLNLLTGQIPNEISSLLNLTFLDLSSNFLSGGIPVGFGSLSKLKLLNLSSNSLSSFVPPQLGNLSKMTKLDLGYNSLFGRLPDELGGLIGLRKLILGNNELKGSLVDSLFKNLTKLEHLDLCGNGFEGELPNTTWNMSGLKYLDVSSNNLTGTLSFLSSHNVTGNIFNFSNNLFYGNLIKGIGNIHILDVSSNFFQGLVPNDDSNNTIIHSNNCFTSNLSRQRSFDDCRDFYSQRNIPFGNGSREWEPPLVRQTDSKRKLAYIMVGVFGGLGFIIVLITGFFLIVKACNIGGRRENQTRDLIVGPVDPPPKVSLNLSGLGQPFTYEEMVLATSNFSTGNLIKNGHSGDIFRGTLEGGSHVVVKRVNLRLVNNESWMSELEFFGRVSSRKLVPLVGHCLEDENEKFLVYKCMVHGDLSNALYRMTSGGEDDFQSLDWITRLKIAIGAAEALAYLHHDCTPPAVHRDVQASSILLDDKYEVRLGSFGEVYTLESNNHHNMIARLLRSPQASGKRPSGSSSITCAYDVYCFGKVLLELVTGKVGISGGLNESEAKQWLENILPFITIHEKEQMIKIVDQSLIIDEDLLEEVWAVAIVAKSCLNPKASRRPSMRHVVKALENPFKVVREENFSSERLRSGSSRQSWTAALFGSWHHSSSESSNASGKTNREILGGLKQTERAGSRGSGANDHSSSHKRSSSDVFPEPVEMPDVERQDGTG